MAKLNRPNVRTAVSSPVKTDRSPTGVTHEGAPGYARDARSELFLLAVSNMVSENTFYERAADRDDRYAALVRQLAVEDPKWTAAFLGWLRGAGNMRTASIVGAAEYVKGRLDADLSGENRAVIASVLQRADEPGELLAYWRSTHGRAIPKPVKRGIEDAVGRLYTEFNLLKYDTEAHGYRFGDVIELVRPAPRTDWQSRLFQHAIDRRHKRDVSQKDLHAAGLDVIVAQNALRRRVAEGEHELLLDSANLKAAGMTWEDALSLGGSKVDKKALWEALIPTMGYMALLRNLRNFDEAGVSDEVAEQVAAKLADPEQVAKSRQFPMRFLSAYRAAPSLRWGHALDKALTASIGNIPRLRGRTLVMVDTSSSMDAGFSKDGTLMRWDAAALFGVALAQRCEQADIVSFSSARMYWTDSPGARTAEFPLRTGESLLRSLDRWKNDGFFLGGGTETAAAVRKHLDGHDRVVILTDEQASGEGVSEVVPRTTPLVTFNLAGYRYGHAPSGDGLRVAIGGLTDAGFRVLPLLEAGRDGAWPWLTE